MPLPDFLIIGAMKSGTSTLHSNLQLHPEIGMSTLKETHFFDKNFENGLGWYKNQFTQQKKINGESTPAYTWCHSYPEVPERIFRSLPNIKLIYVLRDPVERIISHLHHDLYRGRFKPEEIDEVVLNDPQYVETSKYYFQIQHYLKYFHIDDILFVETKSLQNDLNGTLNHISDFLGASNFDFSEDVKVRNQSSRKYLIKNYDAVHRFLPRRLAKVYHWIFYFINIKIERPKLNKKTYRQLAKLLNEDVASLKQLTGKEFTTWKTYHKIQL